MCRKAEVRQATILDLIGIGQLALRYSDESAGMGNHPLCIDEFMKNLALTIVAETGYVSVIVIANEVHGCFWGCLTNMPWSSAKYAQDICFFMDREHRGHGWKLIREWVSWAKARGAVEVCLSSASGIETDRAYRLFKNLGFTKMGEAYSKGLL